MPEKNPEMKTWRKEAREKKQPELNFRRKFWRLLIKNQRWWEQLLYCDAWNFREDNGRRRFLEVLLCVTLELPIQRFF